MDNLGHSLSYAPQIDMDAIDEYDDDDDVGDLPSSRQHGLVLHPHQLASSLSGVGGSSSMNGKDKDKHVRRRSSKG